MGNGGRRHAWRLWGFPRNRDAYQIMTSLQDRGRIVGRVNGPKTTEKYWLQVNVSN